MEKKHIITISGLPGSGKSSAAKAVAKELGYQHFSSGDFMRNIALEMGVSLNELSKIAENDNGAIDKKIDDENRKAGQSSELVVDSRLAFHFIPESFKVFLSLPIEVSRDRIWQNLKNNPLRQQSEHAETPDEVLIKIKDRLASEHKRYRELYGINYENKNNFDLVIDTAENNTEETKNAILDGYKNWLKDIF